MEGGVVGAEEEAEVFFEVGDGGFEAAVGGGDALVDVGVVEAAGLVFVVGVVALGFLGQEVVGGGVEIAGVHPEGFEDVFVDIDFVVVVGDDFDDAADEEEAEVGVAVAGAGLEFDVEVVEDGFELLPAGPGLVPGEGDDEGGVLEAGGVGHEHFEGDGVGVVIGVVDVFEGGDVFDDGVVEAEFAFLLELHGGDAGEGFGDGAPAVDGVFIGGGLVLFVGQAEMGFEDGLVGPEDDQGAADDVMIGHEFLVGLGDGVAGGGEVGLSEGGGGDYD